MSHVPRHLIAAALALLVAASGAEAAPTTEKCLAQKLKAAGKFQNCRAGETAKLLQGKQGDPLKCSTQFQQKLVKISENASDAGVPCRYRDNGDLTVTDYDTGLQWEQKNGVSAGANLANPHDMHNGYGWTSADGGTIPDSTAFTDFLGKLNTCTAGGLIFQQTGFASHCDWRLPSLTELMGILLEPAPCGTNPCIDPIFGPTISGPYMTATTFGLDSSRFWTVSTFDGSLNSPEKDQGGFVRAVRGGW